MKPLSRNSPIIGITLDCEDSGEYSQFPWYALRKTYFESIAQLGGIPIALPHEKRCDYIEILDGLILTGGDFDIPPSMYGEVDIHKTVVIKNSRTEFEVDIAKKFLKEKKPLLGICAGQQLLNVLLGGTLVQHIPEEIDNPLDHKNLCSKISHEVSIIKNTLLHTITNETTINVNSNHHQAVKNVGKNVVINAIAPDGVIEGIEYPKNPFCLGVEWHPEFLLNDSDEKILSSFIDICHI